MKYDYVFPYVNPLDLEWQAQYRMYTGSQDCDFINNVRFRENVLLKYVFRSIDKYMSWIDKCVLILSSDSQILPWMNKKTIKIVKHAEFIPIKYIPTFNSTTIETFIPLIINLNENIIYGNDDIILKQYVTPYDFFNDEGKPKFFYSIKNKKPINSFQHSVKNAYDIVRNENPTFVASNEYVRPSHHIHSFKKNLLIEAYDKYHKTLEEHVTRFRNNDLNINQYVWCDYMILKGQVEKLAKNTGIYETCTNSESMERIKQHFMTHDDSISICINDIENSKETMFNELLDTLDKIFPDKSKYEL